MLYSRLPFLIGTSFIYTGQAQTNVRSSKWHTIKHKLQARRCQARHKALPALSPNYSRAASGGRGGDVRLTLRCQHMPLTARQQSAESCRTITPSHTRDQAALRVEESKSNNALLRKSLRRYGIGGPSCGNGRIDATTHSDR
jgi:hypothetical protein